MDYEGLSSCRATAKQLAYDTNTGNLTKDTSLGEVTNVVVSSHSFTDIGSDSLYTWITYASLGNIKNKPSSIKITSDSGGSNRLRETQFSYDSRGNVKTNQVWLDTAGAFITTGTTSYDQYGNPTQSTDAAGIATTTTYDSTYKQYPVLRVTGTFTNQFWYDQRSGATIQAIDAKGLVASNYFDVFYRAKEAYTSTNANGPATLWRAKIDYVLGGTGNGLTTNYIRKRVNDAVDSVNGHETYTYFDGLGRVAQTRAEAETGQFRVVDTLYDDRGNPNYQTLPYFSSGTSFTILTGTRLGTLTDYDTVGRAYRVTLAVQAGFDAYGQLTNVVATGGDTGSPVGPVSTAFLDGSNPWASVVTDAQNKVKKSFHDAYGRTTKIIEVTSGGNFNTLYTYDLLGNLTNVTDHAGNATRMTYDSIGRKTGMTDPDMGTWSYSYDNAGRLTQQIDARNNKLKFYFNDQLGRLTGKEIYNSGNYLVATITYVYDISDDPNYTVFKGQLYKVTDRQGWQKNSYDVRGRVVKTSRYLDATFTEYVTQSTCDDADRVQQLLYPGNAATIKYTYDTGGNLSKVESVAGTGTKEVFYSLQGLNDLGQVKSYTNGNGVLTTNTFFANSKRLQRLQISKGATTNQDLTYTYDKMSNVTSVWDRVYTGTASAGLTNILYDDLHRLTQLTSTAQGTKTYAYSAIGNILTNSDYGAGLYQYGTKPHAVTNANGKAYAYDACGNMTTRGSQALAYDEENQLIQVSGPGMSVTFGYADGGARLWRNGTNGTTIWIGGIYEIKDGKTLCHVLAGGKLIASFEPQGGGPWAKVFGEERWVAATGLVERIANWAFQGGRSPFAFLILAFASILAICVAVRRRLGLPLYAPRSTLHDVRSTLARPQSLWQRAVTFVSIAAFLLATTPTNVEAQTCSPIFWYYHSDHLGSSNVLTDRSGVRVKHYEYKAFGDKRYEENVCSFSVSSRYTGQVLDEESGLYYYNARYYDPELGRFVQPDTIVQSSTNPQTLNRYAYCGNNPLKYADPSGHDFGIGAIITAVVVGAVIGAATAAATGGDLGMGALTGAVSGLLVGVGSWIGSGLGSAFAGAVVGGVAAGAVNAAITGRDVGLGALAGGIGAVVGFGVGQIDLPDTWAGDLAGFALAAGSGALSGGITASLYGGDFGDGAAYGAIGGAIGYAVATDLPDALRNALSENPRFHLFLGLLTDAFGGLKALVKGEEGAWEGFKEGARDAAGGEVEAFTFGGVKGGFRERHQLISVRHRQSWRCCRPRVAFDGGWSEGRSRPGKNSYRGGAPSQQQPVPPDWRWEFPEGSARSGQMDLEVVADQGCRAAGSLLANWPVSSILVEPH